MEQKVEVLFENDFITELKKGVDILSNAVKSTMGPKGKLVLIQRGDQHPTVTKDGVTVAQSINLENEIQNLAVKVIKEAAARTAEDAGDGTTTSTVLAQAIFNEGLKMKSAGFDMDLIKEGIDLALSKIIFHLKKKRKNLTTKEEMLQIAKISANGEKEIAELIVEAITTAGPDGTVIVEEAKGFKSSLDTVEGFRLERGFLSPYFVTNKNKMNCEFEKPLILLANKEFNSIHEIMKPLELSLEMSKPILIIANDITGDALQGLVVNKTRGNLRVCAIKSPGFGVSRHEMLNDIQTIIGGEIINESFDMKNFNKECFGTCRKIIIGKNNTLIIAKKDSVSKEKINERINAIHERIEEYDVKKEEISILKYRLAQLSGGVAILRVGAATESELIERYDRVDDALSATRAAVQEGILPGGGVALARSSAVLSSLIDETTSPDIKAGIEVMSRAISQPFQQIINNGAKTSNSILDKIMSMSDDCGYDSKNNKYGNMYDTGIIDPYKVVISAIKNASSAACMLLSVECCMINLKQFKDS